VGRLLAAHPEHVLDEKVLVLGGGGKEFVLGGIELALLG